MLELLMIGFVNALSPDVLIFIIIGVMTGMAIGSLPGLTATMGVALLLPLTFGMEAEAGILLLIGLYIGAIFGGSISAILLRTPGTPAAAATALDGYALAQRGEAGKALALAVIASFTGGVISVIMLILISPQLAGFALKFSSPETFALAVFGLSIISSVSGKSVVKGLLAGFVGLLIGSIGMDPMTSYPRYTFGNLNLLSGVDFIPIMIGLFAVAEALKQVEESKIIQKTVNATVSKGIPKLREIIALMPTMIRSGLLGTFIGSIPGAGADIAAFVAYNEAKRFSKKPEEFGTGKVEGIAAAESGNNGVTGGAMVPLLTLGIPGDAVAAVLLGALIIKGIKPGPMIFQTNGEIVYTIFSGMLIANLVMLLAGLLGIRLFTKVLLVPKNILTPLIFMLSIIGSYSLNNSFFDVGVMLIAGVIGYFMMKFDFPASPVVLALILGPLAESELRRSLVMSGGSYSVFYTSPIAATLLIIAIITMFTPIIKNVWKARKES